MLDISTDNVSSYNSQFEFLKKKQNGIFLEIVDGDFTHAADLFVFDRNESTLKKNLVDISSVGVLVAWPNESDNNPDAYIVLHKEEANHVLVLEEDDKSLRIYNCSK